MHDGAALAQAPLAFEVASVPPGSSSARINTITDDSQAIMASYPLIALLQFAHWVPGDLWRGGSRLDLHHHHEVTEPVSCPAAEPAHFPIAKA
jgi:hypothetical protein